MTESDASEVITQALVFLAGTCVLIPALRKARISAVMGFLLIGVAMGPHVLGRLAEAWPWLSPYELEENEPTEFLAELGIMFLLFVIGLEVSWDRLWSLKRYVFGLGVAQVALTSVVIGAIALMIGASFAAAAVLGLAFALSSSALVLQLLRERRQTNSRLGKASLSVLLMQDLLVVPILFTVAALSSTADRFGPDQVGIALATAIGALAAIALIGRLVLQPLFRWVASIDSRETFVAAALLAMIGMSYAAQEAGLSMALGAFLAGMLLADTEFRHQIETDLEPLKDLLLGLFFVTVGMQIDVSLFMGQPILVLAAVVALFAVKAVLIAPLARAFGLPWPRAIEMAFLLGQVGEFAFIVVAAAQSGHLLPDLIAEYMLLVTALSIFFTPIAADIGRRLAMRVGRDDSLGANEDAAQASGHVVVAGCGRVGQMICDVLDAGEIAHVGVDANAQLIGKLRRDGRPFHFGDASRRDVLAAVGAKNATAILVTMDRPDAVERIVAEAKAAWPDVPVFARAHDSEHARKLHDLGADLASPDTVEAALHLGEALLHRVGVDRDRARDIIEERRAAQHAIAVQNE